jgi:hypothetical protein
MWAEPGGVRMRRKRALKRGRWLSLLAAGIVGYVAGNWHAIALRTVELTASQNIALRFPEADADPMPSDAPQAPVRATNAIILGDTSGALLSPAPMIASAVRQVSAAPVAPGAAAQVQAVRVASAADAAAPAASPVFGPRMPAATMPVLADAKPEAAKLEPKSDARIESKVESKVEPKLESKSQSQIELKLDAKAEAKAEAKPDAKPDAKVASLTAKPEARNAAGDGARNPAKRTYVLNDAQIAQIKSRLHLSPDQEQMWPAVEAALRTIAYSRSHGHRGGATSAEVAALDPYGPEVQGLKSAAFPLVMSFSDDQRSEVRTIVHVMGLDQLASQL